MGMFDYRDYGSAKSAELARTTFALASSQQLDKIFGIDVEGVVNTVGDILPEGAAANDIDVSLPENWSKVAPDALGLDESSQDFDGYYTIESPITDDTYSGPQLQILEERDASGTITRLSVTFVGTNSPVDIPDYTQINSGELAPNMEPLLARVRDYAQANGIAAQDVLVTGYSLGAGYTNIMAEYADTLAGGFFAESTYIGHAVPVTYEENDRVLNIGFENDIVHRASGNADSFGEAVDNAPGLVGQDFSLESSTDNLVLFSDDYQLDAWPYLPFALYNIPGGWSAHIQGVFSDTVERISASAFYDETQRDSLVIVSSLSANLRGNTWVEDLEKPSDRHGHVGDSAIIIGTAYDDLLRGNQGNDYIDGGAGDDRIQVGTGADRVEGGSGHDTLELAGGRKSWDVLALDDGTLAFLSANGSSVIASGIEEVTFLDDGIFGQDRSYAIADGGLEDLTWSGLFERWDRDITFTTATQGSEGDDTLSGKLVFGLGGDDMLSASQGGARLVGGMGDDTLTGAAGDDVLIGAEGNDLLSGGGGTDLLSGGLGDDVFVFDVTLAGDTCIADFNISDVDADRLLVTGTDLDAESFLALGEETSDGLVFTIDDATLTLHAATAVDLSGDMLIFA